ncbi:DEAD/DEAH box helicase [Chitinophaga lutea]
MQSILSALGIDALNDMQEAAIAAARGSRDLILLSGTGSGKTLAFLLPVLERLQPGARITQALVIAPTRELAQQIEQVFRSMKTGHKVTACYGGHHRETEERTLLEAPALIVGTPGRLADHIRSGNIQAGNIHTLVLDEFDKSLELGFQEEIEAIITSLAGLQKTILTSATDAAELPPFLSLRNPQTLNFLTGEAPKALDLRLLHSPEKDKADTLFRLLCVQGAHRAIVFCNHRESVQRLSELTAEKGITNVFYHGALEQADRDAALVQFRNGSSLTLITTDIAARGLDIPEVHTIVHYHLPGSEATFVHRNGRTARMDATGTAVMIIGPEETAPEYVPADTPTMELPARVPAPPRTDWVTLFIGAGRKDKVNKIDVVGFLGQKGRLDKADIGLIEVKDYICFVAIRKNKVRDVLQRIRNEKIKNRKARIELVE